MAALPADKPLSIYQGDTYALSFRMRAKTASGGRGAYIDLTGCTVKAQIRASEDATAVLAEFNVSVPGQVGASIGLVNIYLTPAQTTALPATPAVWDLQVTYPDGTVTTVLRGTVELWKEVTR